MTNEERVGREGNAFIAPPKDFDPLTADPKDLARYAIPQRPDPQSQPGLSALWERQARHYRTFEHLQAEINRTPRPESALPPKAFRLYPPLTCGYSLYSPADPFLSLFVTWTVPNLGYTSSPQGINHFRTFVGLGFLDVHVDMTVDATENVTSQLSVLGANGMDVLGLPVAPGDEISAGICLGKNPPGRATYVLANETTSQTVNFAFDSGFPGAFTIDAGISRDMGGNPSLNPLAHFDDVHFKEISAATKNGLTRSLLEGEAVTMVDFDGTTLAKAIQLNDTAFKIVSAT
ncbi:G1 family glutamic endopeptidase [Arthrobacter sp. ES3-54]|uniref:G1 family glutamic endopeptidase n=1 Tax=Arthrobacter sp. ES3-54 TaxID=1502991 RepID=UPI00240666CA|nr:G1 family glutamic endopeptidase [Arthrobacter sp. ES3-54]MDF9750281.1 hypothetical protein [Arthrobacter sp. ES3-54]